MMKIKTYIFISIAMLFPVNIAFAGGFYKIIPYWLDFVYHLLLLILLGAGFIVCLSVFRTLKGGTLDKPWLFFLLAFAIMLARTILGILTVFDIAYFQALVFAGLDVFFFIFFLIGLIIYKIGLD